MVGHERGRSRCPERRRIRAAMHYAATFAVAGWESLVKKVAFGILWFVVLWIGADAIGGGIVGFGASRASPDVANAKTASERSSRGYDVGRVAGEEFDRKYGALILSGALLVSIIGTATNTLPGTRRKVPPTPRNSNSLDVNN